MQNAHKKTRLGSLILSLFVANVALANHHQAVVYVDLGTTPSMAHANLQLLKKMDVLGVNRKNHVAEVSVSAQDLKEIHAHHLSFHFAKQRLDEFGVVNSGYLNPEQVVQALTDLHTQYPAITNLFEVGKTHNNRSIMALEISTTPGDANKPVVLFNGMHHAREVMTPEVVLHIADVLTQKYGQDAEVTQWLNNFRIVLVPQVNPDGNALVQSVDSMWRKNAYMYNGDTVGVDLNRNYPAYWNYCNGSDGYPYSETYRGPAAGSEPETQAMMHLVTTLQPVFDISYHSYSELILYPFGCSSVSNPAKNLFQSIGNAMNANIRNDANQANAYGVGTVPEMLYEADGSDLDWQWKEHGVIAYTIEVNADSFRPNYKKWRNVTIERQVGGWETLLRRLSQSGFRAHIQTENPAELRYSVVKLDGTRRIAFDADEPNRTFALRSNAGLLFQVTEKGKYEVTFYKHGSAVKTLNVSVGDALVDLGEMVF